MKIVIEYQLKLKFGINTQQHEIKIRNFNVKIPQNAPICTKLQPLHTLQMILSATQMFFGEEIYQGKCKEKVNLL